MSYRKHHIKNKIQKEKPKRLIFTRLWFWIVFLVFALALAAIYFLLFYPGLQVANISVSGNENVKTADLQEIASSNANTGLINFLTVKIVSRSMFFVDRGKISREILEKFPIIEKLDINKNWPQTLTIGVVERKPVGVYCSGPAETNCFLIDENGIVFENINLSVLVTDYPIVRQTVNSAEVFVGENVVQKNIMNIIDKIEKDLRDNFKINIKEALITSPLRIDATTSENWHIYFSLDPSLDIALQITKLNLLLNGEISPNDRKNLRYIDLRVKDRAIICDNSECGK